LQCPRFVLCVPDDMVIVSRMLLGHQECLDEDRSLLEVDISSISNVHFSLDHKHVPDSEMSGEGVCSDF